MEPYAQDVRRSRVTRSTLDAVMVSTLVIAAFGGCTTDEKPGEAPPSTRVLATSVPANPSDSTEKRRTQSFVGAASERLAIGESAELSIGVHCGLRYATVDGSSWQVVKDDRAFNGGGGTPLIEGVATRVAPDVVVFESKSLPGSITLRPGERPKNYVCY